MGRKAKDLTALAVSKLVTPGFYSVGHVAGLSLSVSNPSSRSWILRASVAGKRRDIGLGSYPEVSFNDAKEAALAKRQIIRQGIDPIAQQKEAKTALKAQAMASITFAEAAEKYLAAHQSGWKNQKHAAQWHATLRTYVFPRIGKLPVSDINLPHILSILEPIWTEKTETASRVRGRIEAVLDWAKARQYRSGDNPARWNGNLDAIMPARNRVAKVKHHAAIQWFEAPQFIQELRTQNGMGARALEFLIHTACRSGEARGATWTEFDLQRAVWTIPAERMKAGKEHRVPLSTEAVSLLRSVPGIATGGLVFPSERSKPLSDMALTMLLRRMGKDFTVHGFRSTFRDWAGESSAFPREVIEHALAHQLKDKTEAAYARGDLFTKRVLLMKAWSRYLTDTTNTKVSYIGEVRNGINDTSLRRKSRDRLG